MTQRIHQKSFGSDPESGKSTRRISLESNGSVSLKMTITILLTIAVLATIAGWGIIHWYPKPPKIEPSDRFFDFYPPSPTYHFSGKISVQEKTPSACTAANNNTFFVADTNRISYYHKNGRLIHTWSLDRKKEEPSKENGTQKSSPDQKANSIKNPQGQKNVKKSISESATRIPKFEEIVLAENFPSGRPSALCFRLVTNENKKEWASLFVAFGNRIAEISNRPLFRSRTIIELPLDVHIVSMAFYRDMLYLADWRNRVIHCYNLQTRKETVIGNFNKEDDFPGFHFSDSPIFGISIAEQSGLLYATNPILFRIEAFDLDTGQWNKTFSWSSHPQYSNGFSGRYNPALIQAFKNGNLVTTEMGRNSPIKLFDASGKFTGLLSDYQKGASLTDLSVQFPMILSEEESIAILQPNGVVRFFDKN